MENNDFSVYSMEGEGGVGWMWERKRDCLEAALSINNIFNFFNALQF